MSLVRNGRSRSGFIRSPAIRSERTNAVKGNCKMAKDAYESGVTHEQRQEIRKLCQEARVPDKSGEMFTEATAAEFIDDMRRKLAEQRK